MATISELINIGAAQLTAVGVSDARLTAALLLAQVLGCDRTYLLIHAYDEIAAYAQANYQQLLMRRASGEPLQYIRGYQEFYGRDFLITPAVLIPRPETELIIETVLKLTNTISATAPRILDIGTGSGCIAVTLAAELPTASVYALDISYEAIQVAKMNALRLGVAARLHWLISDLCAALNDRLPSKAKFDFCCANPPYVAIEDQNTLAREVRDYEPQQALFASERGLSIIKRLFKESLPYLRAGGYLICEIGFGQEEKLLAEIDRDIWQPQETVKDLQGIPRTLVLKRS
ncbi:MAG: peptide chain release factor N(5)-glutamine methyltransferase [Acidobacteriota bacterium]